MEAVNFFAGLAHAGVTLLEFQWSLVPDANSRTCQSSWSIIRLYFQAVPRRTKGCENCVPETRADLGLSCWLRDSYDYNVVQTNWAGHAGGADRRRPTSSISGQRSLRFRDVRVASPNAARRD